MAQIKKALLIGAKFIINSPDFIYQLKEDKEGHLELWINGVAMEAVVSLTYKHLHISILYAGIWLSKEVSLRDLVFIG